MIQPSSKFELDYRNSIHCTTGNSVELHMNRKLNNTFNLT